MNDVRHVHNLSVQSAAETFEELLLDLRELRTDHRKLGNVLKTKETKSAYDDAHELSVGICHYGESLLLHQRWLAEDLASGRFLNAKEAIHHAARGSHREATFYDFRNLHESVDEMLAVYDRWLTDRSSYIVYDVHDLPTEMKQDFRQGRGLFSLGFDEMGLFACGRGLERVARSILEERGVQITVKGSGTPASQVSLHTLIECLDRLRWDDDSRFVGKQALQLLHWVRAVRNEGAHPTDSDLDASLMAPIVAKAAMSLWQSHVVEPARSLKSSMVSL